MHHLRIICSRPLVSLKGRNEFPYNRQTSGENRCFIGNFNLNHWLFEDLFRNLA
jgi:hypothetical protein